MECPLLLRAHAIRTKITVDGEIRCLGILDSHHPKLISMERLVRATFPECLTIFNNCTAAVILTLTGVNSRIND